MGRTTLNVGAVTALLLATCHTSGAKHYTVP